jgi:thiosulfate/3-mercaptopyruvate sulfurtransferase
LLISAHALATALAAAPEAAVAGAVHPDLVVVDCRFNLLQPDAGRAAYLQGHIPGAWYADLDRDLSGERGPGTGRHPLPDPGKLAALFGGFGITRQSRVVAYDEGSGAIAARLWWLLRWLGHRSVVVLDGGLAAWQRASLPVTRDLPAPRPVRFDGRPGQMAVMDTAAVERGLAGGTIRLLDVRAEDRYLGRAEPIDPVAGHVPGALNVPFAGNLAADGTFQTAEELARRYAPFVAGRRPGEVVCMCGSGVTACHGLLALELASVHGAVLYPGSWSEWPAAR